MGLLLAIEVILLVVTYSLNTKIKQWWHSPAYLISWLPQCFTRSKIRFLVLAYLPFGIITWGIFSWLGVSHVQWDMYLSQMLISGTMLLLFLDFMNTITTVRKE